MRAPFDLGPMPASGRMVTIDHRLVSAPVGAIFDLARDVERWPSLLPHYRAVRFIERNADGGGMVEMSAWRPFGPFAWPTWWVSEMQVSVGGANTGSTGVLPWIRYRHVRGITSRMEVLWAFKPLEGAGVHVSIVHVWNGPDWPLIGDLAARAVIGPVFVHGIASRTLAGLARAAERAGEHAA
jgi:ribosome-associated toxin RatA of RatAB toxin-antitoxin module